MLLIWFCLAHLFFSGTWCAAYLFGSTFLHPQAPGAEPKHSNATLVAEQLLPHVFFKAQSIIGENAVFFSILPTILINGTLD
jgi:hypothetical protein